MPVTNNTGNALYEFVMIRLVAIFNDPVKVFLYAPDVMRFGTIKGSPALKTGSLPFIISATPLLNMKDFILIKMYISEGHIAARFYRPFHYKSPGTESFLR